MDSHRAELPTFSWSWIVSLFRLCCGDCFGVRWISTTACLHKAMMAAIWLRRSICLLFLGWKRLRFKILFMSWIDSAMTRLNDFVSRPADRFTLCNRSDHQQARKEHLSLSLCRNNIWVKKRFMSQNFDAFIDRLHWVAMKVFFVSDDAPWGRRRREQTDSDRDQLGFMVTCIEKKVKEKNCLNALSSLRWRFHHHINGQLSISHAKSISALFAFSFGRSTVLILRSIHLSLPIFTRSIVYMRLSIVGRTELSSTHAADITRRVRRCIRREREANVHPENGNHLRLGSPNGTACA